MNNWKNELRKDSARSRKDLGLESDDTDIEDVTPLTNQEKRQQIQDVKSGLNRAGKGAYKELIDELMILLSDARNNTSEAKQKLGLIRGKITQRGIGVVKE